MPISKDTCICFRFAGGCSGHIIDKRLIRFRAEFLPKNKNGNVFVVETVFVCVKQGKLSNVL